MARIQLHVGRRTTKDPLDADYVNAMMKEIKAIERNLVTVMKTAKNLLPGALKAGVKPIFDESQRLVPVDTGKLKASGFVNARMTQKGAKVDIGYGKGNRPDYAMMVHERLESAHASPTQAKYLTQAVQMHTSEILPAVQQYMKQHMGLEK